MTLPPRLPRLRRLLLLGAASLLPAAGSAQAPGAPADRVVELPEFTVTETPVLPDPEAWSYAQITGFEVLSSAPDREARRLLRDFEIFRQALSVAWPMPARPAATATLILCDRGNRFPQFLPRAGTRADVGTASVLLRNREQVAIVLNLAPTLNLLDVDATTAAGSAGLPDFEVDTYKQLYREYVHFLLSQRETRPPPWLAEGIAQIVMDMEFTDRAVTIGEIHSRSAAPGSGLRSAEGPAGEEEDGGPAAAAASVADRQFNLALARRALLPLDQMFAVTADSPEARHPLGNNRWAKQCYAFVHLCLYGDNKRWQKPFALFVQRVGSGPATEAVFQECFGQTYRQMLDRLRGYIDFTNHQYQRFVLKNGERFGAPPPDLQPATEAQIARLKGDALRLAGHRDAAHTAYRVAYIRGEREPRLLAALGVEEVAAGRIDRGRKLLEAAALSGFDRPSAYVELARLRLAEAAAAPGGENGRLSAPQVGAVLDALLRAQRRPPPLPETYTLAATTWLAAATPPTREQLQSLDSGLAYFPRHAALVFQAIQLYGRQGLTADVARLARHGVTIAPDPETRARFEQVLAALPETPAAR